MCEKNRKILNALPKDWESKVTAIEEAKDLSSTPIESLINSLISYELKLKSKILEEGGIAFKAKTFKNLPNKRRLTKEGRSQRNNGLNKFQITWDDCNSDGDVEGEEEKSAQLALMAFGEDEVNSYHSSSDEDDKNNDMRTLMIRMHKRLKESYAKNKDLKIKINGLLEENSRLFQENKSLKKENDDLRKLKVDFTSNQNDLERKLEEKAKFYEKIKEEQNTLKKKTDDLNEFLECEK